MCAGDDIVTTANLNPSAWAETTWELKHLRNAITAYNYYPNIPPWLPQNGWEHVVERLQSRGYLPSGAANAQRFLTDGWGDTYVPEGAPVATVNAARAQEE